ncbi:hypothetical protein NHP194003_06310 [Helicobacter suis]|uniref:Lipoprotein n=1 Tax=Helicobacter suis TaxID=104628 RepID=A0A6J4CZT8_9HELI|nr:hypothetical protein NHP190020_17040 [Helicobacter suis]BDR28066.1 hypothetical protein HSHS1_08270 [Helicobacter suis HS1]BCD47427.1 hypothetical protein NHP194003_06310 [Helicobacter suis]BCD49181.1 hypothetical protein NHP194004_06280 [Helicobacter suis]BCD51212.1 hypothetical protein NHP194022_08830 [Helicobacter suis]
MLLTLLLGGCSNPAVIAAKFDRNVKYLVQFNSSDFNVGGLVSAEIPYNPENSNMTELLLDKAIAACKCDTLLLPLASNMLEVATKLNGMVRTIYPSKCKAL